MKLRDLLKGIGYSFMEGFDCPDFDRDITALAFDNRAEFPEGAMFVCIKGTKYDTHDFADEAMIKGAYCIIAEHPVSVSEYQKAELVRVVDSEEEEYSPSPVVILVKDTRKTLSFLAANWFLRPADRLITIGITGTKGKSTTAAMIRAILEKAGYKTGIIGTLGVGIGEEYLHTNNTTPGPYELQDYLSRMVDADCRCVVMEVSSQALKQSRAAAITFDYGLFTNLEPDHIGENEHADFEEYMYCKSLLFKQCRLGIGNLDDEHFENVTGGASCPVEAYSVLDGADSNNEKPAVDNASDRQILKAVNVEFKANSGVLGIEYDTKGGFEAHIKLNIPGRFNVYNSLAAIAVCRHITDDKNAILEALSATQVLGRLEPVKVSDDYTLMIDYAHNAMALKSLLETLRAYRPHRLICMFGCGGNRSKERRYEMGEVSASMADLTVVTSDNPRFEEPMDIINDILTGVHKTEGKYIVIPDRKEAIKYCMDHAEKGDLIVLAGKGQEDYQEIKGVKYHMDEREIIADILKNRG
ncbi:MAG: UDP-N-acetylmuramoyl-L-alanyl-D-glutamate--2,6-diaminopimelate ligase [Lachnospiraceae bacterium]|nr:UDP-N-acetylmuramoyl-L-alanyl-D-glutamate--2,6-diaminopimelate ligase [Lachnospiraceae bacterium]